MNTNIGISGKNHQVVVDELAKLLADEYVLYTKTRNAHWNVEGPDFYDKHKFFESLYEQLAETIDNVAERIHTLGHYAPATLKDFLALTHLTECEQNDYSAAGFITALLQDHETIAINLRKNIHPFAEDNKDVGTSDFITALLGEHEKQLGFCVLI